MYPGPKDANQQNGVAIKGRGRGKARRRFTNILIMDWRNYMPQKDRKGPPKGSKGPKDGRGGGKGRASGKGTGPKTGGKKGTC